MYHIAVIIEVISILILVLFSHTHTHIFLQNWGSQKIITFRVKFDDASLSCFQTFIAVNLSIQLNFRACFTNHLQLCKHSCKCSFPRCFFLHLHRLLVAQNGCILKNSESSNLDCNCGIVLQVIFCNKASGCAFFALLDWRSVLQMSCCSVFPESSSGYRHLWTMTMVTAGTTVG